MLNIGFKARSKVWIWNATDFSSVESSLSHHNRFFYKIQREVQILDVHMCDDIQTLEFGPSPGPIGSRQQVEYSRTWIHEWMFIFWPNSLFISLWNPIPIVLPNSTANPIIALPLSLFSPAGIFFKCNISFKNSMQEFNAFCLWKRLLSPALHHHLYKHPHSIVHTVTNSCPSLAMQTVQRSRINSISREDGWRLQYMAEKLLQISEDRSSTRLLDFTPTSIEPRHQV